MGDNILITGPPGVGKTTAVVKLFDGLKDMSPVGFYTREIREGGARKGFELVGHDGRRGVLSHVGIKGPHKVGRYVVDVEGFEGVLISLDLARADTGVYIIDEIGKMECYSALFKETVTGLLDSAKPLIATVALKGGGFIEAVKGRADVRIFTISVSNRDIVVPEIIDHVRRLR